MRNRDDIKFLRLWEKLHNPDFKPFEFEGFEKYAGANAFTMLPKKFLILNYRIHTDATKGNLIPPELTPAQVAYTYANEAYMLNVVLFGKKAKQWKDENLTIKENMWDMERLKYM